MSKLRTCTKPEITCPLYYKVMEQNLEKPGYISRFINQASWRETQMASTWSEPSSGEGEQPKKSNFRAKAPDSAWWLMTWVKGLSWGWTINLFSPQLRTLGSITMSSPIAHIYQNASQSGKLRTCHHQTVSDNRESPGVCQDSFRQIICFDSACKPQPFSSFSSLRTILNEAIASASICQRRKSPQLGALQMDSIWPGLFLVIPKTVLRELNVQEINGSLLPCLYPME